MANNYNPTAANILSSLGVRGSSTTGGAANAGKIPVLNSSGELDVSLIPVEEVLEAMGFPSLSKTAFVDSGAAEGGDGSIKAPFKTLAAAFSYTARVAGGTVSTDGKFTSFILMPGSYGDEDCQFYTADSVINIYALGRAFFGLLKLTGNSQNKGVTVNMWNIHCTTSLRIKQMGFLNVFGYSIYKTIRETSQGLRSFTTTVTVAADVVITNGVVAKQVVYSAKSSQIVNSSTEVTGDTVKDATDSLGKRRVRMPKFSADSTGIHVSSVEDMPAEGDSSGSSSDSSDDYDVHDITEMGTSLATAVNSTFYKQNDSPTFNKVTATSASIATATIPTLKATNVEFGDYTISMSSGLLQIV